MKRKAMQFTLALVLVATMAAPALADSVHIGTTNITTTNQGGQGGQGGNATVINTVKPEQTQVNIQSQKTEQTQIGIQGQDQKQKQEANNEGNHQTITNPKQDRIPAAVGAPGLAAGGTQVCLGSFSVGVAGPMAGLTFGKTVQDKGCEKRQLFILLTNTGDPRAKLVLDSLYEEAMGKPAPASKTAAVTVQPSALWSETPAEPAGEVVCTSKQLRVRAANGEYFCRAN